MTDATPLLPGLSPVAGKSLTAKFDAGRLSSDGGVIVLREAAMRLGLAEAITAPLVDHRDPSRVQYSYAEMALARMVGGSGQRLPRDRPGGNSGGSQLYKRAR
jgi:hypothetical protein